MFMFPLKNLARKELNEILAMLPCMAVPPDVQVPLTDGQ